MIDWWYGLENLLQGRGDPPIADQAINQSAHWRSLGLETAWRKGRARPDGPLSSQPFTPA